MSKLGQPEKVSRTARLNFWDRTKTLQITVVWDWSVHIKKGELNKPHSGKFQRESTRTNFEAEGFLKKCFSCTTKKEACLCLSCLIHWLCHLQGTMNLGLWHITNSNSGCRDYLVVELLPQSSLLGLCLWGTLLWLSCDSERCGNPFVKPALGFQVWTASCEPSMWLSPTVLRKSLLCWAKVPRATFHSQPSGLQFPGEH